MNQLAAWTRRYAEAGEDYLFGTEPNHFLTRQGERLLAGSTAVSVADGEGRNSVWLARQGLAVTAVEISPLAVEKARRLAATHHVEVDFQVADLLASDWPPPALAGRQFDWVVGIFIQFVGAADRVRQFAALRAMTRPGGRILLQGYTPRQLHYRTGGPSVEENLYTAEGLRESFADWDIEVLQEYEEDIEEGQGHRGRSALIGLVARRPAP